MTARRCARCAGSLFYDRYDEEWRCLLCARVARLVPVTVLPIPVYREPKQHTDDQDRLLEYVTTHPGQTASEVARAFGISSSAMKSRIDTLYTRGELRREGGGGNVSPWRWYVAEIEEASA